MKKPPKTIIDLPSDLHTSPFFDFYYSGESIDPISLMMQDLEKAFIIKQISDLEELLLRMRLVVMNKRKVLVTDSFKCSSDLELPNICRNTWEFQDAILWILQLTEIIAGNIHKYKSTGAKLVFSHDNVIGAIIEPL